MSAYLLSKYIRLKYTNIYIFLFVFYKRETLLSLLKEELKLRVSCNKRRVGYLDLKGDRSLKNILDKIS
jgi:hypothetical protein